MSRSKLPLPTCALHHERGMLPDLVLCGCGLPLGVRQYFSEMQPDLLDERFRKSCIFDAEIRSVRQRLR